MSDDKPEGGMLKTYKNRFLQRLYNMDLSPESFEKKEGNTEGHASFQLKAKDTPLHFTVRVSQDSHHEFDYRYVQFAPGTPLSEWLPERNWASIEGVYDAFSDWYTNHVAIYLAEVTAPDLWAQIQSQKPVVSDEPVGSDDREQFSKSEQDQIQMAISEFRQIIIEKHAPTDEQLQLINNRLDYLSEQVSLLNRINWRALALGTLIAVIIQLYLGQEQGKELFELGQRIFSNIVPLLPE